MAKKTKPRNAALARASKGSSWRAGVVATLRPPPKLSLSAWADANFYLSAESAAEPGRWKSLAYQRGILDAITDRNVERVSVQKSARVGFTKCLNAAVGYYIHQDPCPILVVQPTVEDAEGYSKEEIAPMLRDCSVLTGLVSDEKPKGRKAKKAAQTILHKVFPGGVLSMVGANSGRGFRRVSRRLVIFDEVDGYPASAGKEGDPIKLGERRSEYYWNRKLVAGSTPLVAGASRIEELFAAGDRRRYYVPCPHCGHMDVLRFSQRDDSDDEKKSGHVMRWSKDDPSSAHFVCPSCGCAIEETNKRAMIEAGEWRPEGEFNGHASFHIWAAYSLSPNATWAQLVEEFLEAKTRPETLRTFVNTALGETWQEQGEAPEWERLYQRRELYKIRTVPDGVIVLTAGVDVQKDRFVYEVVGWAPNKESWSVDAGILWGDTSDPATWRQLDALLDRAYLGADGAIHTISMLAVDSGYNTQEVYNWARQKPKSRVMAVKGEAGARMLVGAPSKVEVNHNGKKLRRGYQIWPVGVNVAKSELYGWLGLRIEEGAPAPAGYCHFPEYGEDFFKQLTAEQLITTTNKRTRRTQMHWAVLPNRENHHLDTRVYARAAAAVLGIDRLTKKDRATVAARKRGSAAIEGAERSPAPAVPPPLPASSQSPARQGFWKKRASVKRAGGWFGKRR